MVIRTARKGRSAGGRFWGCSQYPRCRGIVNIEGPSTDSQSSPSDDAPQASGFRRRVTWTEAARRAGWRSFYATAGGRLRSWDFVADGSSATAGAISHAAFYLSGVAEPSQVDDSTSTMVDVLRRILTRGDRPPVDPMVEEWILESTGLLSHAQPNVDPGDAALRLVGNAQLPGASEIAAAVAWRLPFTLHASALLADGSALLSSRLEETFMLKLVPETLGPSAGHWFHPQAPIGALIANERDARRVDFLVHHPELGTHVVELDGSQHSISVEVDRDRDQALDDVGIATQRLKATDLEQRSLPALARLVRVSERPPPETVQLVWAAPVTHRIARAIVEGVAEGWLTGPEWRIRVTEPTGVGAVAVHSALELLSAIAEVWGAAIAPERVQVAIGERRYVLRKTEAGRYEDTRDGWSGEPDLEVLVEPFTGPWHQLPNPSRNTIVIRSAPLPIALREGRLEGGTRKRAPDVQRIRRETLERLLLALFAKREFYPAQSEHPRGQEIAIRRVLGGFDTAVLLPTGAGKSLIYQYVSLLLPGRTLVIDPIVALIDDQLDGLAAQGIDRAIGITSADNADGVVAAKLQAVANGDVIFCFIAPERLQQRKFRDAVRSLTVASPINVCVVDEAHCVSEWGHDFRTSYLDIGRALRAVSADSSQTAPPILALTGTASRSVLRDMLIELDIDRSDPEAIVSPQDFDRPELRFSVVSADASETGTRLVGALRSLPARFGVPEGTFFRPAGRDTFSGIIFSAIVNPSRNRPDGGLLNLQALLESEFRIEVGIYSGGRPKDWSGSNWNAAKREFASAFKRNELPVLVATKAYGMGIDKPNVRYIVHAGVPGSIEAYYQEAGRAGRDRQQAQCVIVHDPLDRAFWDWAHTNSYAGEDKDLQGVQDVLQVIGDIGVSRTVFIPRSIDENEAQDQERAIHRLKLLGVVRDYMVEWGGARFEVMVADTDETRVDQSFLQYVRRTQPARVKAFERDLGSESHVNLKERVVADARRLLTFIYETVVNARTRALDEMVKLTEEASGDQAIRQRILDYLALGQVAQDLEQLVDAPTFSFGDWLPFLHEIDTVDDAREWRGATARLLESTPDHPGLLVGRALAEAVVSDGNPGSFTENLAEGLANATGSYLVDRDSAAEFLEWMLGWLHERKISWTPLGFLVAERFLGAQHLDHLKGVEFELLADTRSRHPGELAIVGARRIARHARTLELVATGAKELNA